MRKIVFLIISVIILQGLTAIGDEAHETGVDNSGLVYTCVEFFGDVTCNINTVGYTLSGEPFIYLSNLFLPIDDILPKLGFTLGWDDGLKAIVCVKDDVVSYVMMNRTNIWVGPQEYQFDLPPMVRSGVTYISAAMFDRLTKCDIKISGEIKAYKKRDTMQNTYATDDYRLNPENIAKGGGVTVVNGFGMEYVKLYEEGAKNYAAIINMAAEQINADVYCIAVPTSGEFYAPKSLYPNQLPAMKALYADLSDKVTPVNGYDALKNHAGEKIYFGTDHHWTQRGAYYVYKEFIECAGGNVEPPESFTLDNSVKFAGSLANFSKGTAAEKILRANPDVLERFLPKYADRGAAYYDQGLTKKSGDVYAVDMRINSYGTFLSGDNPIVVFHTTAPSDKTIVIIKESFGNAFSVWAMNNYKNVYVVDPRKFNGFGGNNERFDLKEFCEAVGCDDLVFINYPVAIGSSGIRTSIFDMIR